MKRVTLLCLLAVTACGESRKPVAAPTADAAETVKPVEPVDPVVPVDPAQPIDRAEPTAAKPFKVVGYFPTWSGDVNAIPYQRLTHLNYSFVIPTADGNITSLDDPNRLRTLVQRAHAAKVKVLIAVGGWNDGDDSGFRAVAGNEKIRQNFVRNVMNFVQSYQLDGVDIDWEYPDGAEVAGYDALMTDLSDQLHAQNKLLSAAVTANDWPRSIDATVVKAVDYLNIMVYDMGLPHSTLQAAQEAVVYWKDKEGLPKEKLILGLPFYSSAKGYTAYKDIIAKYGSTAANSDTAADGLDYNGQPTVKAKTQLALKDAAGIMIWEISQDTQDSTSLLKTIADEVAGVPRDAAVATKKASILQYVRGIAGQKTLVGIENKNAATPASDSATVTAITGRSSSVWGGDFGFGKFAIDNRKTLIEEAKKQFQKGSLVTLMYHACAPTQDEYCSWDDIGGKNPAKLSDAQFRDLLTPGTDLYKNWISRLDTLAVDLNDLKQAGVVVVFRPLHEVNQCVFWWSCHKGTYGTAQLYRLTHDYLTQNKGLDNLIWAWNIQDFTTLSSDVDAYSPGPEYFDLATLDVYNTGYTQNNYDTMLRIAAGKPIAIGECQFMPTAALLARQNKWVYALLWPDFIENNRSTMAALYAADPVLTLDEMPGW